MEDERALFRLLVLAFFFLCGLSLAGLIEPSHLKIPWSCPFKALTGHPCPGCGMSDAFKALLAGRLKEAFYANPNVYPLFFFLLSAAILPEKTYSTFKRMKLFEIWLFFILGWWILRLLEIIP